MSGSFNIIRLFVEHRVASSLLMAVLVLAGVWGARQINTQLNPSQPYNLIEVDIEWPGASAEDVERLITRPIERELQSVSRLRDMTSTTRSGHVAINLEFITGTDNGAALDAVKQRIGQVRDLPTDMEIPVVKEFVRYEPVASVLISGAGNLSELIPLAKKFERDLLAAGVDKVEFRALPKEEIAIQVDRLTMLELGMSLDQMAEHIAQTSSDVPSGTAGVGDSARQLRGLDQQRDVNGFSQLPVLGNGEGHLISLGDIAHIEQRYSENSVTATQNNQAAIMMQVLRAPGTDTLTMARALKQWHKTVQAELSDDIDVMLFLQVWKFTEDQINLVIKNGLGGLILVIATLFLFLNGRLAWWVMLGIPVSFAAALTLFYFCGGTINVLSMIGLVMALGIVVDDAIVVGEHSQAQFDLGKTPSEAATLGANNMVQPVFASSLTTLAAFIPILMVDGGALREIPLLMICIIIVSLMECFWVMPGHLRGSFSAVKRSKTPRYRENLNRRFDRFRDYYFSPVLKLALANRRATLCLATVALVMSFSLLMSGRVKPELSVGFEFDYIEASIKFANLSTEEDKQKAIQLLEDSLFQTSEAFGGGIVVTHVSFDGMAFFDNDNKTGRQYSNILVELVSPDQRDVSIDTFAKEWRSRIPINPMIESLQLKFGDSLSADLSLYFQGSDITLLKQASEQLKAQLRDYPGVTDVYDDLPYGKDQWIFSLNAEGRELGLTAAAIGRQVYAGYEGVRIQLFHRDDREVEVKIMLPDSERSDLSRVRQFPIKTPSGEMTPLYSVATIESRRGIDVIQHNNSQLAVNIYASVDNKKTTPMAILNDVERTIVPDIIEQYDLRYGLSARSAEEQRLVSDILLGAVIGLTLMYIILSWIFSSYSWPLVVMLSIPLALTGALAGLYFLDMNLGVLSILGLFTLAGVIVNDSIILVNTYSRYRAEGMVVNTAMEAAVKARLRAVVLTSLTTTMGLLPMLFETSLMGAAMRPLAAVICFGMLYGTVLILLVIPCLLSLLETLLQRIAVKNTTQPMISCESA